MQVRCMSNYIAFTVGLNVFVPVCWPSNRVATCPVSLLWALLWCHHQANLYIVVLNCETDELTLSCIQYFGGKGVIFLFPKFPKLVILSDDASFVLVVLK